MKNFSQLKKNLKNDFSNLKKNKVAVLGDSSTQFLVQAIRGCGFDAGLDLQIWEADFNQIERQVLDPSSALYDFNPEIVILFRSSHQLLGKYNKLNPGQFTSLAADELKLIEELNNTIISRLNCKVIFYNYTEINDSIFGNYATQIESSFLFQLRKLNYQLMLFASGSTHFYLCDISTLQNQFGKSTFFHPAVYVNAEMVLSIDILPAVAGITINLICAMNGQFKKCIIVDLDNTVWGGIIGDDGLENIQIGSLGIGKAFSEFQYWIKKLKNRGIIIAVCSKNNELTAKEPFEKHPDMVLKLEDIAVFIANWENKADNIRKIQSLLNIGFDSMVFLDDNPFERNMVRENIPDIIIPELPEDPAHYLEYLYSLNLFETISFTAEDEERTKLYQVEAQRSSIQQKFTNEDDFLQSLNMTSLVQPFNTFNTPRVAQLSQRSNQFNLRTVRYTEADIERLSSSADYFTFAFTLEDKFGDNGLIAVIILHKEDNNTVFIDTWLMSCRILKRGMENFVLDQIINFANKNGFVYLKGEYLQTAKNEIVKNHYQNLDFTMSGNFWILNMNEYVPKKTFIKTK